MAIKKKTSPKAEPKRMECVKCGSVRAEEEFFLSPWSGVYNTHGKRVPVCKACFNSLMEELSAQYDEKTALLVCCAVLDVPFYTELYNSCIAKGNPFSIGVYMRQMQFKRFQGKTFGTSLTDGSLFKEEKKPKETGTRWSKKDKQNMNYSISTVGYDPFEDCNMTEDDRKYCFNILAGYCDIEGIKDDGHKLLGCVQIVKNQLQVKKLDDMINQELISSTPDETRIKSLTESKKKLQDATAKIAQDNNISSAHNDNSKRGKNTLTQKMKDILEDGYEAIRVNLFDIKTSEAVKQVADLSNRSIIDQLAFDSNDYSQMVKEQREILTSLREEKEVLEEENRNLKNELSDLKYLSAKRNKG